ncbi:MAG: 30S ribosomal protein S8e [Candidatus Micrarchaeota archaeon]|nr:30S ribosomal protein S8e [Candidatus Micrarchaeota archaeon]
MGIYHRPVKTKTTGTGAKKTRAADNILAHYGRQPTHTKIGESEKRKILKGRGNTIKLKLKTAVYANVRDKNGQIKKVKIKKVLQTPDNRHFTRQNILTKGGIIETEIGKAKITNRVGQDGVVNAILID